MSSACSPIAAAFRATLDLFQTASISCVRIFDGAIPMRLSTPSSNFFASGCLSGLARRPAIARSIDVKSRFA